ncbi:fumarate hydratase [Alkalihalophilus marmarensis]|uniref:fumarate hydratase n=1 Tax=Alkalihalophilus marmarensis TaxID=521377 RepID=UPI00203C9965|nr:fumarate hydratase [Alkalihalophilus marmarensis]MCM3491596.1 fumarate hydratase [Alkalihalophilus marmarensis]
MKQIHYEDIVENVSVMCQEANYDLGNDIITAFKSSIKTETSETGRNILSQLIDNANIASSERVPMCQDTGVAVFIVEIGREIMVTGGSLTEALNEGVRKGYEEGYLRHSIVEDPLSREKSKDYNAPAVIHVELVEGDHLTVHMSAKGGGSENMSRLSMLTPADGIEGIKEFILKTVEEAGPNACPPLVVGVGIGGNFELSAYLAKKSLFRPIEHRHPKPHVAKLEKELIKEINNLGVGPQGMGGSTTALDVKVEIAPCHIAALPVAVNLNCHASRYKTFTL